MSEKEEKQFWCYTWECDMTKQCSERPGDNERWCEFILWISTPELYLLTLTLSHHFEFSFILLFQKERRKIMPIWEICSIYNIFHYSTNPTPPTHFSLCPNLALLHGFWMYLIPLFWLYFLFWNPKKIVCMI